MLIGMSAAVVQGVAGQTLDVDIWVGLSPRQYMRPVNIAVAQGATMAAKTVVYLEDGLPVNFVYEVTGLPAFKTERKRAVMLQFHGRSIPVLPLDRICRSKAAVGRDKDLMHIKLIEEFLKCQEALETPSKPPASQSKSAQ